MTRTRKELEERIVVVTRELLRQGYTQDHIDKTVKPLVKLFEEFNK